MSAENDEFDYKIGDDEEEEEMYAGDDVYSDSSDGAPRAVEGEDDPLDHYAMTALGYAELVKIDPTKLRHTLLDKNLGELAKLRGVPLDDLLISSNDQDEHYNALISTLYPPLEKYLSQVLNPAKRATLVELLGIALSVTIWEGIEKMAERKNLSVEKLISLSQSVASEAVYHKQSGLPVPDFANSAAVDRAEVNKSNVHIVNDNMSILKAVIEGYEDAPAATPVPVSIDDEEPEIDQMEVDNVVKAVLKVYDNLYAPCFINKPLGVLTPNGILKLEMDGSTVIHPSGVSYAKRFYKYIGSQTGDYLGDTMATGTIDSSYISPEGELLIAYSPVYHLRNINGMKEDGSRIKTWPEFRRYLAEDLTKKVSSVLSKVETEDTIAMQSVLLSLFTNCIIMDKFDVTNSMKIRMKIAGQKSNLGKGIKTNAQSLFGKDLGEVVFEGTDNVGIYDLLYVFDIAAYTSEILFSYKAHESLIESGNMPSITNVVVGKGLDGKDITINLANPSTILTGILAGSGSGKGVLTLNILASLYAEGCPVMYLDHKPDMSGTLWQMERYLKGRGYDSRIFSIDSKEDRRDDGQVPIRRFPYGHNSASNMLTNVEYALFPYLKTLQFAGLLSAARASGVFPKKEKMFFILDETQLFTKVYVQMIKNVQDVMREKTGTGRSAEPSENAIFAEKVNKAFGAGLRTVLNEVRDVTGRVGLVGMIVIAQKVDPEEWATLLSDGTKVTWKDSWAGQMISSLNLKFIGKGAGTSPKYSVANITKEGINYIDDKEIRGYWAMSGKVNPDDASTTIFKSYLTLNDNDFDHEKWNNKDTTGMAYTAGVLNGIKDPVGQDQVIHNEFLQPDGKIRDTIGFLGLMKLIGGADEASLAEKVSRGYNQMEAMFNLLGLNQRYSCVEEYLYDCSPDSIFTYAELRDMMSGGSADAAVSDESSDSKDWMGSVKNSTPAFEVDTGVSQFGGGGLTVVGSDDSEMPDMLDDSEEAQNVQPRSQQTMNPASQPLFGGQRPSVEEDSYVTPTNKPSGYDGQYAEQMVLPNNPFRMYGTTDKPISAILSIRQMSKYLMDEILRFSGDYGRIESLEVTANGLVINNVAFRPRFEEHVVESMPFDIRKQVASGNVVELFHFENLRKFRNLVHLRIDNSRLAEGRVRREIGLSPRKTWAKLFDWFPSMNELYIGGERITDQETAQEYDDRGRGGFSLTEKLRNVFGMGAGAVSNSRMERVWDSKPVRVMTGAVGWTVGIKCVALAASMFGPWGLLFGAFAGYGAYRELKNRRENRR